MAQATDLHKKEENEGPWVLIAEDHNLSAKWEAQYFHSVGYNVAVAQTGAEAGDLLASQAFDVLIIDTQFAQGKGVDFLAYAKERSQNKGLKVLLTCTQASSAHLHTLRKSGADAVLEKPYPRPKLLRTIKNLSGVKSRSRERIKQVLEVQLVCGPQTVEAMTIDLSPEGAHLAVQAPGTSRKGHLRSVGTAPWPPLNQEVTLLMPLGPKEKPLELVGQVVRHTTEGFGVRFHSATDTAKKKLERFFLRYALEHRESQYYL